ncbi:hypothetical protein L1D31_21515 [Vibrio sp. Isolate23]|uniref:hypothetical protein n=1 Tax=Vibrio sp. Isolate23 TaxID=2908533 RepID=UPI001EFD104B|nr:hypothetical protein [Vibrio sp. Isolate23]MDF5667866.1 hypothetical protein [Vibrio parahaemolyticus]MDW1971034.1 hypothetical protein [Vibrio sp. 945]MCG9685103.1 hypothetical protein [Vibrio sp. Isolate23]HCE2656942.1 hypothetical protein [Vibrio parahaemolyticus]HCE2923557.1 hypothetical protein [Vibrio parahaemolyticus]
MQVNHEQLDLDSAYGDGWYDGFLHARKISENDNRFDCLEDYSENDVLQLSEHAEAEHSNRNRKRWSQTEPTEQGLYWHWSGNTDDAPIVLSVLRSGTNKQCFVSTGQYGIKKAVFCKEYGGWWAICAQPKLPENL